MDEIITQLRERNEPVPTPLALPTEDELLTVEEALLLPLHRDYRAFLASVSDVVYGSLEPATASDPSSHTYLPELAAVAWDQGLPRYLIPICARAQGYDCLTPDGDIVHFDGEDITDEQWDTIWDWASEIWLQAD